MYIYIYINVHFTLPFEKRRRCEKTISFRDLYEACARAHATFASWAVSPKPSTKCM